MATYQDTAGTVFKTRQEAAASNTKLGTNPKTNATNLTNRGGSARGDDFADPGITTDTISSPTDASAVTKNKGESTSSYKDRLKNTEFKVRAGYAPAEGSSPTVMTNANKIEKVVPLLNSKVSNLSASLGTGSNANFTNGTDTASSTGGDSADTSFYDALGMADPNKKKKKNELEAPTYSPMEQQQLQLLQQMSRTQDKRLQKSIADTQRVFDDRARQQQDATAQGINTIKQVLNLGGSSRYAPVSSQNIISAAEAAGIKALSDLDATEQRTIAEIESARDNLDYQTLEKKFNFLDGIRKEKAAATSALEQSVQERETQVSRDNALAGLVAQGITDPVQMLNMLNFDEQGNKTGDFTLGEITGSLKSLKELTGTSDGIGDTGFKLENKAIGQLLGSGWTAPDIKDMQADLAAGASIDDILAGVDPEMQDAVKKAFGIDKVKDTNLTPGKGAKTSLDEALIRTRLFSKIAPILNKGTLSDTDRQIIDSRISEFRDAGMGEQEILDTLAGIPPEVSSPYNGKFRDLIVSNSDTMEKQNSNIGRLSQQLASGNYTAAMNTVETLSLNEAKKIDPDSYIGNASAQIALKKGKELKQLASEAEELIGPFDGTWENIKNKLAKNKDPRAAEISAKIADLMAPMRKEISGSAVTDSETRFLEPLIPDLSDTSANFGAKVKALNESVLNRLNAVRSSVSLPEVTEEQVIEPNKRLMLYSNDIYLPKSGDLDL